MPSAVPGSAAAIGLPPVFFLKSIPASSIFRSRACIFIVPSKRPRAGSSPASSFMRAKTLRSMPAAKLSLADVITIPLTASSASARSTSSSSSPSPSRLITFMDLSLTSQVMTATPPSMS